ncbi:MAG: endolytic transglycosylase MltG [Actinomycetes bacterium]
MRELSLSELPGRRDSPEDDGRQRRRRRRRTAVVLLLCLVLVAGAAYAGIRFVRPLVESWNAPNDYTGPGSGTVRVQIHQGDSGRAIGRELEQADVVLTTEAFVDAAKKEPRAAKLQPGTYELKKQMKASDALALLLDPASRVSLRVQLREGLRVGEVYEVISENTGFTRQQLEQAVHDPAVGLPPEAGGNPEGYLFPATYEYDPDVTPVKVLAAMVDRFEQAMTALGVPPEQRREVLIKASLVEAEGRSPGDMAKIARVIENRLAAGMNLQLDTTVNYVTGKRAVTTTAQERAINSPYNTYLHPGLPPGPIDSPGETAISAALHPEPGPWLYFVTVNPDTGETRFATTEQEHAANVQLFRKWLQENR